MELFGDGNKSSKSEWASIAENSKKNLAHTKKSPLLKMPIKRNIPHNNNTRKKKVKEMPNKSVNIGNQNANNLNKNNNLNNLNSINLNNTNILPINDNNMVALSLKVNDEYDPSIPNDYNQYLRDREKVMREISSSKKNSSSQSSKSVAKNIMEKFGWQKGQGKKK